MENHSPRILLMYITEVSGHHRATMAIDVALRCADPDVVIKKINGFGYVYPTLEKIVNKAYLGVIKTTPKIWDYLYDNPTIVKRTKGIKEFIHRNTHKKIATLFDEFQPDAIVCTQAFPCGLAADYKTTHKLGVIVIGVLTDHAPHAYWVHEGVDYYVVPSEEEKVAFIGRGVPEEKIRVFGIPLDEKFSISHDKITICQKLGLDPVIPIVLIMGGGQGLGPIKKIVARLVKLPIDLQIIVLAGINKKLIRFLRKVQKRNLKKLIFFEYTNNVDELMEVSDLLVTKAGGMTTTEALTKALPMVIVRPIPGQEIFNTNYLLRQGVAIRVNRVNEVGVHIAALLQDPHRLRQMSEKAKAISRPYAAQDIAKLTLEAISNHV